MSSTMEVTDTEKIKCQFRQSGRNCPLDTKDVDHTTFCEAYRQGDGYVCIAAAKEDPVEDDESTFESPDINANDIYVECK